MKVEIAQGGLQTVGWTGLLGGVECTGNVGEQQLQTNGGFFKKKRRTGEKKPLYGLEILLCFLGIVEMIYPRGIQTTVLQKGWYGVPGEMYPQVNHSLRFRELIAIGTIGRIDNGVAGGKMQGGVVRDGIKRTFQQQHQIEIVTTLRIEGSKRF